ncbi:MAG: DUF5050 domain-containing protein [Bacillota bacterium]|nr:DUF5050 domain-containing protein [Bacillota bacterium]
MKIKITAFMLALLLFATFLYGCGSNNSSSSVAAEAAKASDGPSRAFSGTPTFIFVNGTSFLKDGNTIYFSQPNKTSSTNKSVPFQVNSMDAATKKIDTLFNCPATYLFLCGDSIFYTGASGVCSMNKKTKTISKIADNSTLLYVDSETSIVYFRKTNSKNDVCSQKIGNSENQKIFSSSATKIFSVSKLDGKLYFVGDSGSSKPVKSTPAYIYTLKSGSSELTQITEDISGQSEAVTQYNDNLTFVDGWIYYTTGAQQSSDSSYQGKLYRISPDGNKKELIDSVDSPDFTIQNGFVYYGHGSDLTYTNAARLDGSQKQDIVGVSGQIVYADKNYVYRYGYDSTNGNFFYRTDLNNDHGKKIIVMQQNKKDKAAGILNELATAAVLGDKIYYTVINVTNKSDGSYTTNAYNYYRINIDGTSNELLSSVDLQKK